MEIGWVFSDTSVFQLLAVEYNAMQLMFTYSLFIVAYCSISVAALPPSVIDELKSSEKRSDKGKDVTAQSFITDQPGLSDWEQDTASFINKNTMIPKIPTNLYNAPENIFDDKSISDYEKGFRYGSSKDHLDEALENEALKSEIYGEPGGIMNQIRLEPRMKREVNLSPEEVMTLLALYERRHNRNNYRYPWNRIDNNIETDFNSDDLPEDDENWLDNPVYPHATTFNRELGSKYILDHNNRQRFENRGRWGGFDDSRNKRYIIHKKISADPTRELRYINGPNQNDFYTLSQLLNNQREPNLPVVQRLIL